MTLLYQLQGRVCDSFFTQTISFILLLECCLRVHCTNDLKPLLNHYLYDEPFHFLSLYTHTPEMSTFLSAIFEFQITRLLFSPEKILTHFNIAFGMRAVVCRRFSKPNHHIFFPFRIDLRIYTSSTSNFSINNIRHLLQHHFICDCYIYS